MFIYKPRALGLRSTVVAYLRLFVSAIPTIAPMPHSIAARIPIRK